MGWRRSAPVDGSGRRCRNPRCRHKTPVGAGSPPFPATHTISLTSATSDFIKASPCLKFYRATNGKSSQLATAVAARFGNWSNPSRFSSRFSSRFLMGPASQFPKPKFKWTVITLSVVGQRYPAADADVRRPRLEIGALAQLLAPVVTLLVVLLLNHEDPLVPPAHHLRLERSQPLQDVAQRLFHVVRSFVLQMRAMIRLHSFGFQFTFQISPIHWQHIKSESMNLFFFSFFFVNIAGNVSIRIEIQSWISVNTNGETCAAFINRKERGEERESKKEMRDLNGENDDPARCDKIQEEAQRFILARWIRVVEPARHHGPRYLIQDQDVDSATFHSVSFFLQYLKKNQASVPECSVERRIYGEADRQSICHLQFWWDFKSLNFSLRLVSSDFNHKLYPNSIKLNHDHRSWSIYHYLQESKLWK